MKGLNKVLLGMMAGLAMCACSSDIQETAPKLNEQQGDGFYMNLDIMLPNGIAGSRSQTTEDGGSTGGTEVGSDAENTVTSALIILAAHEALEGLPVNGFIAAGEVKNNNIINISSGTTGKSYRATASIQKANLNLFYAKLDPAAETAPKVNVYVFCNPTSELISSFSEKNIQFGDVDWLDKTCTVKQGGTGVQENLGIWGTNSFLMNNVSIVSRMLPKNSLDWENFNSVNSSFHLSDNNDKVGVDNSKNEETKIGGPIEVERSVARFDFKDGSEKVDGKANTYSVLYHRAEDAAETDKGTPVVNVQLQKMALVNMSNQFYYLPRVSDNGQNDGTGFEICGLEKPWTREGENYVGGNYVVGPYAGKFAGKAFPTGFSEYFNYPFFNDEGEFNNAAMASDQWDVYKIEDVLNGRGDNYEVTVDDKKVTGTYKVWRYVTENAIPGGPDNQVVTITTGVLFKARLLGAAKAAEAPSHAWDKDYTKNLALCLNGEAFEIDGINKTAIQGDSKVDPILYYIDGHLHMTWPHLRQAAIQAAVTISPNGVQEINRSGSLYKAVFGEGPIPSGTTNGLQYVQADGTKVSVVDPLWSEDNQQWQASADYAWTRWNKEGKPSEDGNTSLTDMRAKVTGSGITIYQSSKDDAYGPGYYCYYYYWNRHNDNDIAGVMAPMEFDVVRNNVYKLSVDKISRLGHPRKPENDPNKPKYDDPDESDQIYLDVTVTPVPWGVRVNSIIF